MPNGTVERRLAAIMSADVAGYTRLMAADELATLDRLNAYRSIISGLVKQHGGRVVDMVGDNLLAEFPSAVDAVQSAMEIQAHLASSNAELPPGQQMRFRIGINIGDLIIDGERIVGNGVNVAARIEAEAQPGGVAMSGTVYDQVVGKLDFAVRDKGFFELKNVPRPVRIYAVMDVDEGASDETNQAAVTGPGRNVPGFGGRHAIAVLPFANLSTDPEQEYFADGLAEDLIASLATLRIYPVIARNSSFAYRSSQAGSTQIGQELGAQYLIAGSVRKAGNRVRVNAELVDATDNRQLWSGRYDREIKDIFALQDELVVAIAGAIGPALSQREIRQAMRRPTLNLDAWDCIHRGMYHLFEYTREDTEKAIECAHQAIQLEPGSSRAWALLAFGHMYGVTYQHSDTPKESQQQAIEAAQKAVALDKDDPLALTALGYASSFERQYDAGLAALERAIEVNPSSSIAYWALGTLLTRSERPDDAIPMIEKAMRLSPQDPLMHEFHFGIGAAHFVAGRFREAAESARSSLNLRSDQPGAYRLLAASCGHLGLAEEGAKALQNMLRLAPGMSEEHLRLFLPEEVAASYVEGWRKAGWTG